MVLVDGHEEGHPTSCGVTAVKQEPKIVVTVEIVINSMNASKN